MLQKEINNVLLFAHRDVTQFFGPPVCPPKGEHTEKKKGEKREKKREERVTGTKRKREESVFVVGVSKWPKNSLS